MVGGKGDTSLSVRAGDGACGVCLTGAAAGGVGLTRGGTGAVAAAVGGADLDLLVPISDADRGKPSARVAWAMATSAKSDSL